MVQAPGPDASGELGPGPVGGTAAVMNERVYSEKESAYKRTQISVETRNLVFQRDQGRCQYLQLNGKRCESTHYIDIHHRRPVSVGGDNSITNLITLCGEHHRHWHRWASGKSRSQVQQSSVQQHPTKHPDTLVSGSAPLK
jgi:5-methylcytosine-specific restriction endonuclease McrA